MLIILIIYLVHTLNRVLQSAIDREVTKICRITTVCFSDTVSCWQPDRFLTRSQIDGSNSHYHIHIFIRKNQQPGALLVSSWSGDRNKAFLGSLNGAPLNPFELPTPAILKISKNNSSERALLVLPLSNLGSRIRCAQCAVSIAFSFYWLSWVSACHENLVRFSCKRERIFKNSFNPVPQRECLRF